MSSLSGSRTLRRTNTPLRELTGVATSTKTTRGKLSFQLKQRHQRDIPPQRILHDTVSACADSPSKKVPAQAAKIDRC
jgi:hypothetical protein